MTLGLLAVATFIKVNESLHRQGDDGLFINVAGRQRMLSQKMLLLAERFGAEASNKESFRVALVEFREGHELLFNTNSQWHRQAHEFDQIANILPALEDSFQALSGFMGTIDQRGADLKNNKHIDLGSEFLTNMEMMVAAFESFSRMKIENLIDTEGIILMLILTTLTAEWLFIFKPGLNLVVTMFVKERRLSDTMAHKQ